MMESATAQMIRSIETHERPYPIWIELWYLDHIKPILEDKDPRWYFDEHGADDFFNFIESFCRNPSGVEWKGKPIELLPFQKSKYEMLYGIKDRETEQLRFSECFDERPRKNGKTTEVAPWCLYETTRSGAEVYAASGTQDLAMKVWNEAKQMIDDSELCGDGGLASMLGYRTFPHPEIYTLPEFGLNSHFYALSHDNNTNKGKNESKNVSSYCLDEVHLLDLETYTQLHDGTSANPNAIGNMIGSNGKTRLGFFDQTRDTSKKIIVFRSKQTSLLPLLWEANYDDLNLIPEERRPKQDDLNAVETWIRANPAYGVIKTKKYMEDTFLAAQENPMKMIDFLNKDLDVTGTTQKAWLPAKYCINHEVYSKEALAAFDRSPVIGGFDLAASNDMQAAGTLIVDRKAKKLIFTVKHFATKSFIESSMALNTDMPWDAWKQQGLVKVSGVDLINDDDTYAYFAEAFAEHRYEYKKIKYDPWGAKQIVGRLNDAGWKEGSTLSEARQGFKTLSPAIKFLFAALKHHIIVFQDNPLLEWELTNAELIEDKNGNWMLDKSGGNKALKIDGLAVLVDCLVELVENMNYWMPGGFGI